MTKHQKISLFTDAICVFVVVFLAAFGLLNFLTDVGILKP